MAQSLPVFFLFTSKGVGYMDFHLTMMGKRFYEHDVPKIAKNLETLAQEQAKANQLKERELDIREKELNKQHNPSQN